MSQKYYVIEISYVGPNQDHDANTDVDKIEISTVPAITNLSREVCVNGWCGDTNGWSIIAYGEYDTLEEARAAVFDIFGDVRAGDEYGDFVCNDPGVVEVYKPGKYEPLSLWATADWLEDGMRVDITADTSDEAIRVLVNEYEVVAMSQGYMLNGAAQNIMRRYRQELRDDRDAMD